MRTSVVIPCFKHAEFLEEAVDSVLSQTVAPLEVIVVDDGSPEPLKPIPNRTGQPPIRWYRIENRGLGGARNFGARQSTGVFLAFLDADDIWEPEKLEQQESFLDSHTNYVGCYTECVNKPGFFPFGPYLNYKDDRRALAAHLWRELFFPPSCILLRKESYDRVGGFLEGLPNGEDLELWIKLLQLGPLGYLPKELCGYRQHSNQMTVDNIKRVYGGKSARLRIIQERSAFLEECGIDKDHVWDAYRNDVLTSYFKRDFKSASFLLKDYLKDHPLDLKLYIYWFIASFIPKSFVLALRD
jgi:glycosyltransferase involved in cell wall biosynthesis